MSDVKSELSAKALGKRKAVEQPNSVGGNGDRVVDDVLCEIKSSLLNWADGKRPQYSLEFHNVKAGNHAHRYLAWMSPSAIHIWKPIQVASIGSSVITFGRPQNFRQARTKPRLAGVSSSCR